MNILYIGTIVPSSFFEELNGKGRYAASYAPMVFESQLVSNLLALPSVNLDVISFPILSTFPKNKKLLIFGKKFHLAKKTYIHTLPFLNLHVAKQITLYFSAIKMIKKWLANQNPHEENVVLLYSLNPFISKAIQKSKRVFSVKTVLILPDLPYYQYYMIKYNRIMRKLVNMYLKECDKYMFVFDGYVLFSEHMKTPQISSRAIVIEGMYDEKAEGPGFAIQEKRENAIMYAGAVDFVNGIKELVDSFNKITSDFDLWIFGNGDATGYIQECAKINSRIKYYGYRPRNEILEFERKAKLLVNIRRPENNHTKFSFPSKVIEYLASGTPVLATRLEGIPKEYFDYMYTVEDLSNLTDVLMNILTTTEERLFEVGLMARKFILSSKSAYAQTKKVYDFLCTLFQK